MTIFARVLTYGTGALFILNAFLAEGPLATLSWLFGALIIVATAKVHYNAGLIEGRKLRGRHFAQRGTSDEA